MNRRIVGAITALVLAAMGTFVLLAYVRTAEDRAMAGEQVVEVLFVDQVVAEGTSGDELEGLVRPKKIPAKIQAEDSVTDVDDLSGKVAAVELLPGEQVLATRFVAPEKLAAAGEVDIPDGLHQVTVSLEPQRALGGNVRPGDTVGVVASFDPFEGNDPPGDDPPVKSPNSSHFILHKVLVTKVQGGAASSTDQSGGTQASGASASAVFVTLATDAPSVERIVFAAEHGFVWLSNEPEDAPERGTRIQTRGTVYE